MNISITRSNSIYLGLRKSFFSLYVVLIKRIRFCRTNWRLSDLYNFQFIRTISVEVTKIMLKLLGIIYILE